MSNTLKLLTLKFSPYHESKICNESFDELTRLNTHYTTRHHEQTKENDNQNIEKPNYNCNFCSQKFEDLGHLESHISSEHQEKNFVKISTKYDTSTTIKNEVKIVINDFYKQT